MPLNPNDEKKYLQEVKLRNRKAWLIFLIVLAIVLVPLIISISLSEKEHADMYATGEKYSFVGTIEKAEDHVTQVMPARGRYSLAQGSNKPSYVHDCELPPLALVR